MDNKKLFLYNELDAKAQKQAQLDYLKHFDKAPTITNLIDAHKALLSNTKNEKFDLSGNYKLRV